MKDYTLNYRRIAICSLASMIALVFILALIVPSSPISLFKDNYNADEIQQMKNMYKQQGIILEDKDIEIEKDSNGNTTNIIIINEQKKASMVEANQQTLNRIFENRLGITPPHHSNNSINRNDGYINDYNDKSNEINGDSTLPGQWQDPDSSEENAFTIPDVNTLLPLANAKMDMVDEYFIKALNKKDQYEEITVDIDKYFKLLLESRQTNNPDQNDIFPFTVSSKIETYKEVGYYLNGQTFFEVTNPEITNFDSGYKLLNTSFKSEDLYCSVIDNSIYKEYFENKEFLIEEDNRTYTCNVKNKSFEYKSLYKLIMNNYTIVFGHLNTPVILDIYKN